jgi:hypothetical protein
MTKRETQIAEMEAELRRPIGKARKRDLQAMLAHAKALAKKGR